MGASPSSSTVVCADSGNRGELCKILLTSERTCGAVSKPMSNKSFSMVWPMLLTLHLFIDAGGLLVPGRSGDNWETQFPSLTTWVSENLTQVFRVGTRHFSPLSHPAGSLINYFINRKNKWDERFCFSDIGEELFSSKVVDDIQAPGSEPLFFILPNLPKFPKHDPFFMRVNTLNFIL